jgi:hypothetical protein
MQPIYFLLRDNQESGPYTIDELLLQRLTSTDLVWVQGRTNAWCHPSELEEFTVTYSINREKLNEIDPIPGRQSSPRRNRRTGRGEIENRAEEIRKNILSQAIISGSRRLEIQEDESPTSFKIPEERIDLVVHKKRVKLPNPHFLAIGFMLIFIAGAWFGRDIWVNKSRFLDSVAKPFEENATVVIPEKKQTPVRQSLQTETTPLIQDSTSTKNVTDSINANAVAVKENISANNKPLIPKKAVTEIDSNANNRDAARVTSETAQITNKEAEAKKDSEAVNQDAKLDMPVIVVADKSDKENKEAGREDTAASTKTEKKKGFFGRLFKKKKDGE